MGLKDRLLLPFICFRVRVSLSPITEIIFDFRATQFDNSIYPIPYHIVFQFLFTKNCKRKFNSEIIF